MAFVILIGVPLTSSTIRIGRDTADEARIRSAANAWATSVGWKVQAVDTTSGNSDVVRFIGPAPVPTVATFREALEGEGADPDNVVAEFVFEESIALRDRRLTPPVPAISVAFRPETAPDPTEIGRALDLGRIRAATADRCPPGDLGRIPAGNRTRSDRDRRWAGSRADCGQRA